MKYTHLGRTDIRVSKICLGTMTWGQQNSEPDAHEQLDAAMAAGINFIDAAEMYPVPPKPETQGLTETYIGSWLKERGNRDSVVLATKIVGPAERMGHIRNRGNGLKHDAEQIAEAIDASLQRLQTDYIDLYQIHWPERSTNYFGELGYCHKDEVTTPPDEILTALGKAVDAGKIRAIGLSNDTPWGVMKFAALADAMGLPRIVSVQNPYNLLNRTFEVGLAECAIREDIGLLAYSPLAFGVLSGKYLDGAQPEGARLTLWSYFARYTKDRSLGATKAYVHLARDNGLDPAQMALAFVHSRDFLTSTIVGATTMAQLESDIASFDIELSDSVIAAIEAIHAANPNPAP